MEKLIVDRIEEGFAVLEKDDLSHITVALGDIALPLREGSVLAFDGEKYTLCEAEESSRKEKILSLQEKLKNKSKKN